MKPSYIQDRKTVLTDKFNSIQKQVNDLNAELRRLEGGFAELDLIEKELLQDKDKKKEAKNG
jgi:uncharacterized protein YlxW (UPF0749 family)